MLSNVKVYFREEGKLAKYNVDYIETYSDAIVVIRTQVLGANKRGAILAVVNK